MCRGAFYPKEEQPSRQTHLTQHQKSSNSLDATASTHTLDTTITITKNCLPIHQLQGGGVLSWYLHKPVTASGQELSLLSGGYVTLLLNQASRILFSSSRFRKLFWFQSQQAQDFCINLR
ncbi:hypothetical protein TNCV_2127791 [Trichonephila clavipes]|nr:hypothetical protein TNCV_2127791 [Trichonephila clavipes]